MVRNSGQPVWKCPVVLTVKCDLLLLTSHTWLLKKIDDSDMGKIIKSATMTTIHQWMITTKIKESGHGKHSIYQVVAGEALIIVFNCSFGTCVVSAIELRVHTVQRRQRIPPPLREHLPPGNVKGEVRCLERGWNNPCIHAGVCLCKESRE